MPHQLFHQTLLRQLDQSQGQLLDSAEEPLWPTSATASVSVRMLACSNLQRLAGFQFLPSHAL